MRHLRRVSLVAITALLILAPSASASFPGRNGVLATWGTCGYSNYCTGPKIFFITPHGHSEGTLDPQDCRNGYGDGSVDCDDTDPAWGPNGNRLAFVRDGAIYVADRDGGNLHAVPGATGALPAWSADGTRIVYQRGTALAVIPVAGGTPVDIVADGHSPAWSSRGRIAFARGAYGHENLFSVRPDGSGLRRLTYRGGTSPNWSPGASRLAFNRGTRTWTLHADGTHPRRLINRVSEAPVWSPDGRAIAFLGAPLFDSTSDLFVVRLSRLSKPWKVGSSEKFDWQPRP